MAEQRIKIETHLHTSEVSRCGKVPAGDMVARFAGAGYRAAVVTDHLLSGWKAGLPLEKRVDRFLAGYRAAAEAG
ncbi:MAG: transposase, partial [Clostridiales bacterium]|nr:transposase [Clostridiales bacterium]